jgi:hypothetical protein
LSETSFSSKEIKGWLEHETRLILTPVQTQAKQLRDEMNKSLQDESDVSRMLLDNSAKEIDRRNMRVYNRARALNKLAHLFLDRLKKISAPEQVTYNTLSKYAQDAQKVFIVADIDIKNWFPRISPFFIMDRRKFLTVHEKAKATLASLNDFVTKEYVKTKTIEDTFQQLNELYAFEEQLLEIENQRENLKNERAPLEKEISELENKNAILEREGPVNKLKLVNVEIKSLGCELKHSLRHIQKPFIKMQALSLQGGGSGLTPDEVRKLGQYLEKPFQAFSAEPDGYPMLKQILAKMVSLMDEGKLKLKSDKARKAEQSANDVLRQDSLASLHARCNEMAKRKQQLLASAKLDEITRSISLIQEQIEQVKARKASVEAHETVKDHEKCDIQEKIQNHKHAIEKNVFSFLNKKIRIV